MTGTAQRSTLGKDERLHGRKEIARLLSKGKFRACRCLRYCFCPNEAGYGRIMVSVPKRLFKRAVKRNTLKRRIRESYRLQKHLLPEGRGADILFIYNSKEIADSKEIFAAAGQILKEVADGLGKS